MDFLTLLASLLLTLVAYILGGIALFIIIAYAVGIITFTFDSVRKKGK